MTITELNRESRIRIWEISRLSFIAVSILFFSISFISCGDNAKSQKTIEKPENAVRVATYNIKNFSTDVVSQGDRLEKLKEVIKTLKADIVALQEIADRQSLELLFPPEDWNIIIDDESESPRDLAVVLRKPITASNIGEKLNAGEKHFLFPDKIDNLYFPERRDLLCIEAAIPGFSEPVFIMNHHAKSRSGGRKKTQFRRVAAAQLMVMKLESDFSGRNFILLGDFNDNPDDKSLNILETGESKTYAEMENRRGGFLINITETLCSEGFVSYGRDNRHVENSFVNTLDRESRKRNFDGRGTNVNTGDILFDQILIPHQMSGRFIKNSATVFNSPAAVLGNDTDRASDHLPVFADFLFQDMEEY